MKTKNLVLTSIMMLFMVISAFGQTNLTGRIYYNANIMKGQFDDQLKELDKEIATKKAEAIAKSEKKLGRKLTAAEQAKLNNEIDKAMKQAKSMMDGMKTAVTLEFKTATQVVMKMDMKIDDNAMKAAGVPWLKRKAMKAALAIAPSSEKETYVVKGNKIIIGTGKDQDVMTLSADGKTITGEMDGKKFTLTRTK
jgi:sugar-specific transcriptional regulator TrmB